MARPKLVWNLAGFEEIRRNDAAVARIQEEIDRILDAVNQNATYEGDVVQAPGRGTLGRAIGHVWTTDFESILDNSRNHSLLRALAGRGMVLYTSKSGKTSLVTQKQADNWTGKKKG